MKNPKAKIQKLKVVRGQSLFEILFALTISSIILVGVVSVASFSVRNSTSSRNKALANRYANEVDEWLKLQINTISDWSAFHFMVLTPIDHKWCLESLDWTLPIDWTNPTACGASEFITGTIFKRELTAIDQDSGLGLKFTTTVFWTDSNGTHSTTTTTVLTDWTK